MNGKQETELKFKQKTLLRLEHKPLVLTDYYYWLVYSGKSHATVAQYIDHIIQFLDFTFEGSPSSDFYKKITAMHIQNYLSYLSTKKTKWGTTHASSNYSALAWSSINSLFHFLVPDYTKSNPIADIPRPEIKSNSQVTYLTEEEILKLLKSVEQRANQKMVNRDLCLLKLGFATGLRISDIIQINMDDLDLDNNRIRLTEQGDFDEYICIGDNLKAQILLWVRDRIKYFSDVPSDALFVSQEKKRLSARSVRDLLAKYTAGVIEKNVTSQVMRHSCAINLYKKTGDICLCANQLRHKNLSTTQRYADLSEFKNETATEILDDLV